MTEPTPSYPDVIAQRVRDTMKAKGKRPVDLEKELGYKHASAIRRYTGKQAWSTAELEDLAYWLRVPRSRFTAP